MDIDPMFERFTDRAMKVMALANQEAQRFNHEYIGTEHILLGLIKEGRGVGATVLKKMNVDLRKVRLEVEKLVKSAPEIVPMGKLPHTPRAKKVIEYAIEEARNLNHNYVGTEHLLLGLLREREGIAAKVLMNLGLKLEEVREEVLNLLGADIDSQDVPEEVERRAYEERFHDHPLVQLHREEMNRLLEARGEAGKAAEFERASKLREQWEAMDVQLLALYRRLHSESEGAEERTSFRYCLEVQEAPVHAARAAEARDVLAAVHKGLFALLVGPVGSGCRTVLRLVSALLRDDRGHPSTPSRIMVPNHGKMRQSEDGYPSAVARFFQELAHTRSILLAIPDLHLCADPGLISDSGVDAWKHHLWDYRTHGRSVVGTATREGCAALQRVWPGLMDGSQIISLQPLVDAELTSIISARLEEITNNAQIHFENGFSEAILDARKTWPHHVELADPGRVLILLEAVVAYGCGRQSPNEAPRELVQSAIRATKERALKFFELSNWPKVRHLIKRIEGLQRAAAGATRRVPQLECLTCDDVSIFLEEATRDPS